MVETQIAALQLLALDRQDNLRTKDLVEYYLKRREERPLPPLAQLVERVLRHWDKEIAIADLKPLLQTLDKLKEPAYQHQDCHRLENLPEYLEILKHGPEELRLKALEQIEQTLLRLHNPHAIAWDFGGVLMDGHNKFFIELYAYSKGINLPKEKLIELWQTIFKGEPIPGVNYDALKIGQATPEQFASHAIENFNHVFAEAEQEPVEITDAEIRKFLTLYYSHYDPKHENREVLHRLSQLGIRQYGLTNNFMAKVEYFLERHEFDYLQGLVAIVSEKFGASKPDPRIYLSFKQHVFLDRFAKDVLQVKLPNQAIDRLWQTIFEAAAVQNVAYEQQRISCEPISEEAISQYNRILKEYGYAPVDVAIFAERWLEFWAQHYDRIAFQTIFVDDKTKNLNRAFEYEGIMGVHYDANKGQKITAQPVIQELLDQEQLKQTVRTLRELATAPVPLGQKAQQALERLMPFRIRREKLIWQAQANQHQPIVEALSNEQIYILLQQHYESLYRAHFKLGKLVSHQYALIHRLAILPEYTYDEARQIVLQLFETSELFLDQNRDRYPWQAIAVPEEIAAGAGEIKAGQSLLEQKLLPEIKHKIVEYVSALEVFHQPIVRALVNLLQIQVNDLQSLKQFMERLLQQLLVLQSIRVVPWQQIEQGFKDLRKSLEEGAEPSLLSRQLDDCYQELRQKSQQTSIDLLPLQKMISEWEQDIHHLESTYFQQYHRWKILKDEVKVALYQDTLLDEVREQFSSEDIYQFIRGLMLRVYDLPCWKDLTKPTMILVSGASGSGKSTLATHLTQGFGMQKLFSTDEAGRANTKAILDFLFGQEAAEAFPGLYQSSFEGTLESYYYQSILIAIGVEGLAKRLHKQNTSALIEGVGLMPGLLSEQIFELLNIDWLVVQVESGQHWQHFERRAQVAAQRSAKRYQDNFEMIRQIHDRIVEMGLKQGLTIVENQGPIAQAICLATERIQGPLSDQFTEIRDSIREQITELLEMQRQHLPVKVQFDIKRAAMSLGIGEQAIIKLLHRFGFEEVPHSSHQWMRQPLRDVEII